MFCVDLTKLNNTVLREHHALPSVDHLLARPAGSRIFSKLDCNAGFHQIPLAPESARLITFTTPFGCFFTQDYLWA